MAGEWTLGEIARLVGGELTGDPAVSVRALAPLERAEAGDLSFVVSSRHAGAAARSRATAFLAPLEIPLPGRPVVRVAQPYLAVATLLGVFHPESAPVPGVHPTAHVAASARVAPEATVMPFASVGEDSVVEAGAVLHAHATVGERCRVGEGSVLHPHAVLRQDVTLGRRVVVHPGAVLGADGFGYAFDGRHHRKIPQVGRVVVGDDVEIGANATVDRATLGDTVIGAGTKVDNLVQIGHNVEVGADTIIVAQVGISGSCRVGSHVVLAGQVGLADHAAVGDGAQVGAQSGVVGNVPAGAQVFGSPALPAGEARRVVATLPRVPALLHTVRRLEKRVAELERRLAMADDTRR
jgi:UDP-3-O-[3-hydroxymyristoyl] glucosamine N-acyltransferase